MTAIVGDIGGSNAIISDVGGATAPLLADLRDGSQATTTSESSDDLSLYQAVQAPVVAGILALNVSQSDTFRVDVTADITAVVLAGWPASGQSRRVAIYFVQDDIGGHVVTWPASYKWSNGIAHALSTAPNAIDCFVFASLDGGASIFGNVVGLSYA